MDVARRCVYVCVREREREREKKNEYIKNIKTEMFLFLGGDNFNHQQFMGNLMCKTIPMNT